MKHIKPTIALIAIIAILSVGLYWPKEAVVIIVAIACVLLLLMLYFALYDYFNKK